MIKLTTAEMRLALTVGGERHIESLMSGRRDNHGKTSTGGWTEHIEGAAGELAAAKCLNLYWDGSINTFKHADIGVKIQVRTRSQMYYDLIVRDDDNDNHLFVLVLGQSPEFEIAGCMSGREAKQPQWRQAYAHRPAAFFVPQDQLHPLVAEARPDPETIPTQFL